MISSPVAEESIKLGLISVLPLLLPRRDHQFNRLGSRETQLKRSALELLIKPCSYLLEDQQCGESLERFFFCFHFYLLFLLKILF